MVTLLSSSTRMIFVPQTHQSTFYETDLRRNYIWNTLFVYASTVIQWFWTFQLLASTHNLKKELTAKTVVTNQDQHQWNGVPFTHPSIMPPEIANHRTSKPIYWKSTNVPYGRFFLSLAIALSNVWSIWLIVWEEGNSINNYIASCIPRILPRLCSRSGRPVKRMMKTKKKLMRAMCGVVCRPPQLPKMKSKNSKWPLPKRIIVFIVGFRSGGQQCLFAWDGKVNIMNQIQKWSSPLLPEPSLLTGDCIIQKFLSLLLLTMICQWILFVREVRAVMTG